MSEVFLSTVSPTWSPSHVKDIIKLERMQRQALKLIMVMFHPILKDAQRYLSCFCASVKK